LPTTNSFSPPKDQQAQLAELLWAMDEVIERGLCVSKNQTLLKKTAIKEYLLGKNLNGSKKKSPYGNIPRDWNLVPLYELRDPNDRYSFTGGPFGSDLKSEHYTESGVRILQLQNIGDGEFLGNYEIFTSAEQADKLLSCNIFPGEIILAKMAPVARCALIPDIDDRYLMCSDGIRLKVNAGLYHNNFIYHAINTDHFKKYAESKSTGSTRCRIGLNELKKIPVPVPKTIKEQMKVANIFKKIDNVLDGMKIKINSSKSLQKSLINQIF
jgi:type I restriction enzyme, S subunit